MVNDSKKFVALLRAVNVGGTTIIKMDRLRKLFEEHSYEDVSTYIQSGNVIFSTSEIDRDSIAAHITHIIWQATGLEPAVFVLDRTELADAAEHNPFAGECQKETVRCVLLFLSDEPDPERVEKLMGMQGEEYLFHVRGKVLYYSYPVKRAANRRTINFEKVLGVSGTSRAWKVVDKLIELLA